MFEFRITMTDLKLVYLYGLHPQEFNTLEALREEFRRITYINIQEQNRLFRESTSDLSKNFCYYYNDKYK